MDYKLIPLKELVEYLMENKGKDVGFTLDTEEDVEIQGEPQGWYGAKIDNTFDGNDFMIGDYGVGIIFISSMLEPPSSFSDYMDLMKEFFADEGSREMGDDDLVYVWAEDLEGR